MPFYGKDEDFKSSWVNIVWYHESHALETWFGHLELVKSEHGEMSKLRIKNLPAGEYILYFLKYQKSISIKIFRGAYWVTDEFVVAETGIAADLPKPIFGIITNVKTENKALSFKVWQSDKNLKIRAHVYV